MSKTAVVTGGAKGIGEQICRVLHSHGITVIIVDLLIEQGQVLANELQGSIFKCMDVSKIEQWRELVKEIQNIDYLFLNAGIASRQDVPAYLMKQIKPDLANAIHTVKRAMEVNFFQTVYGVGTVVPIMQQRGSIMVTASMAGLIPLPGNPIYVATKHAVIGYMRSIKKRLNQLGIKSYVVCPGFVNTDILGAEPDKIPFQKLDPKFVAEKMVDLVVSEKPSQIVTLWAGRDPVMREQKKFVKLFEQYDVKKKLKSKL